MKPKKGDCIPNDFGSARGLLYKINNCLYFALPGVPKEMKAMMKKSVIPILKDQVTNPFITRTIRTTGIPESALAEKITNTIDMRTYNCSLAYLPKLSGVDLRISSQDEQQIQKFEKKIKPVIEKYVYGYEDEALEEVVGNTLKKCRVTLATAESCTGGLLGHRITQVSGSSEYYLGGVVSYNEDAKINLLDVTQETLTKFGAVSEETVKEMALGVRKLFSSDLGMSITGIAGPTGGTEEKPVGLVYIGLSSVKDLIVKKFNFFRDRDSNKQISSQVALNMLRLYLRDE
jgi:nicotinamide-nucleotide amidase